MRISETFGKLDRAFLILFILSLFSLSALAQSVKGIVKDQAGDAIIGATVKVVGTKTGAITDADGQFTVKAGANSTLSVTYVGYTTKRVAVNGKNNIVIVLDEDNTTLNDLVVSFEL